MSTSINDPNRCMWCGGYHQQVCPLVKAIEYGEDGRISRVEFLVGPPATARADKSHEDKT